VSREQHELEDLQESEQRDDSDDVDDSEELEELEDVAQLAEDDESQEDEEDAGPSLAEGDDTEQASLEELLAQRGTKRAADDSEDEADIMSFPSEGRTAVTERLPSRVAPIRDRQEFVCKSCHLVKPRVQLADQERRFCRDCV
jgi:hypothetical protein